ncbi:MAG: hypothetical protein ACK40U_08360, partial [Fervidobacterium pennivorans]
LTFKNDELAKSKILAKELNISESDFINIQFWFNLLLLKHQEATSNHDEQLKVEKELETKFNEMISSEIERQRQETISQVQSIATEIAISLAMKVLKDVVDEKAKREYLMRIIREYEK